MVRPRFDTRTWRFGGIWILSDGFCQIQGAKEVQSTTSLSPRTSVRGEEPHPSRGATVKCRTLSWVIPESTEKAQQNTEVLDQ